MPYQILTIEDVIKSAKFGPDPRREALIKKAYEFARKAHEGQKENRAKTTSSIQCIPPKFWRASGWAPRQFPPAFFTMCRKILRSH